MLTSAGEPTPPASHRWPMTLTATDSAVFECHRVRQQPTAPAALLLEFAAEAARQLAPGMSPRQFTDGVFPHYLRARPDRALQITATDLGGSLENATVAVCIGTALPALPPPRDIVRHIRVIVHLSRTAPPATRPAPPPVPPTTSAIGDPYFRRGAPIELSDMFGPMINLRRHGGGATAILNPSLDARWKAYRIPVHAIDCLIRIHAAAGEQTDMPVVVPTSFAELTLHTTGNDVTVTDSLHPARISYTGNDAGLYAHDGRPLIRLTGLRTRPLPGPSARDAAGNQAVS